jgi:hypothetical protein
MPDRVALGIMRQVLLNHLGGGQGIEHFFDQFTGPTTAWWKVLGSPELNAEVPGKLTVRSSFSDCTGAFTTIRAAWKHFWSGSETRWNYRQRLYVPHKPVGHMVAPTSVSEPFKNPCQWKAVREEPI